jgi:hypothetical protein
MRCWTGSHIQLAAFSALYIVVFIPLAIKSKLELQLTLCGAHIQHSPKDILSKTALQGMLLFVRCLLSIYSTATHGALSVMLLSLYMTTSFKVVPFNIPRFNLYNASICSAIIWAVFCLLLAELSKVPTIILAIVCFVGLFGIATATILISLRIRTLFQFQNDRNIAAYFRFQLSFSNKVELAPNL